MPLSSSPLPNPSSAARAAAAPGLAAFPPAVQAALTAEIDQCYEGILAEMPGREDEAALELVVALEGDPDGDLPGHLRRVALYAELLAEKCGLSRAEAIRLRQIAPMHDVGKWFIPKSILEKPGRLTASEFEVMKTHTLMGHEILRRSRHEILQLGGLVAIQHQEKFDGSGYPHGLRGADIHLYSRITTVADVFDALGSERSYKQAWEVSAIVEYLEAEKGRHFDPVLVDPLLGHLDEFLAIRNEAPPQVRPRPAARPLPATLRGLRAQTA